MESKCFWHMPSLLDNKSSVKRAFFLIYTYINLSYSNLECISQFNQFVTLKNTPKQLLFLKFPRTDVQKQKSQNIYVENHKHICYTIYIKRFK